MRFLVFIVALLSAVAVLQPALGDAQLFDGPEPADETPYSRPISEHAGRASGDGMADGSFYDPSEYDSGEPPSSLDYLPTDELISDDAYLEAESNFSDCADCGSCSRGSACGSRGCGCGGSGWICLEDVINWQTIHYQFDKWCAPLKKLPAMDRLHKLMRREPLHGTSWLNRPYHADWFMGAFVGDDLVAGRYKLDNTVVGGYRLGQDVTHHWGYETRLMFAAPDVQTPGGVTLASTADVIIWDVSGVYYPWGDTTTRPYFTAGLGIAHFDYRDIASRGHDANVLAVPIGLGVKCRYNNWTLLRLELLDNISMSGSGVSSMHNFTLTGGFEIRFGGVRTGYWPWNPGSYHR